MRWVLTRELEDSRPLAEALGLAVVPCIERVDLPWPGWEPLVFVTSPHVARRLVSQWPGRPPSARAARVAAVSPSTSAVLEAGGVPVAFQDPAGAVGLARAVAAQATRSAVLYPTSDQGLEQPEQAEAVRLLEGVGPVRRAVVYRTQAPEGLAAALAAHQGDGFVFFSPSAVKHFLAARGVAGAAVCVGASTARAWPGPPAPLLATPEDVKKVLMERLSR